MQTAPPSFARTPTGKPGARRPPPLTCLSSRRRLAEPKPEHSWIDSAWLSSTPLPRSPGRNAKTGACSRLPSSSTEASWRKSQQEKPAHSKQLHIKGIPRAERNDEHDAPLPNNSPQQPTNRSARQIKCHLPYQTSWATGPATGADARSRTERSGATWWPRRLGVAKRLAPPPNLWSPRLQATPEYPLAFISGFFNS